MKKHYAIILIGPPGSGKSSIAHQLAKHDQVEFIETGELLRQEMHKDSNLGKNVKWYLKSGKLAPTELVVQVVDQQVAHVESNTIIFDGSPRRPEEIDPFLKMLNDNDISISRIIVFQMSRDEAFKRLSGRRKCSNCGKIYNIYYDPPEKEGVCDKCGGTLVQREDDKPNLVNERLQEFEKSTAPVIRYFRQNYADKILEIDAQEPIEKVANTILTQLQKEATLEMPSAS